MTDVVRIARVRVAMLRSELVKIEEFIRTAEHLLESAGPAAGNCRPRPERAAPEGGRHLLH